MQGEQSRLWYCAAVLEALAQRDITYVSLEMWERTGVFVVLYEGILDQHEIEESYARKRELMAFADSFGPSAGTGMFDYFRRCFRYAAFVQWDWQTDGIDLSRPISVPRNMMDWSDWIGRSADAVVAKMKVLT